ncbi:MAG: hypothetical protein FD149_2569 [Rhodospirillaceae bacterium]|nr:MAG: hypothetical protein FD149_2569 [Rhodospirillaceae bacterium]
MALSKRSHRWPIDIWPGFVDALSTLLIIIIFMLMVFVLAQFLLGYAMFGQTQEIGRLSLQIKTLNEQLVRERREGEGLRRDKTRLGEERAAALRAAEEFSARAAEVSARLVEAHRKAEADARTLAAQALESSVLRADLSTVQTLKATLDAEVTALGGQLGESEGRLAEERERSAKAQGEGVSLREELARLAAALALAERQTMTQKAEITSLSGRLDAALANKVEELARYRSEFFGRLRAALGEQAGIRIEGDRFVFQSEVLFDAGAATLGDSGKIELDRLAATVLDLMQKVPPDINWVLRVDGHTDRRRIATDRFPSNWELSTGRALSVLHHLVAQGIPPERLAVAGFGEYQSLDPGNDDNALRRNRRIEIRFDQR